MNKVAAILLVGLAVLVGSAIYLWNQRDAALQQVESLEVRDSPSNIAPTAPVDPDGASNSRSLVTAAPPAPAQDSDSTETSQDRISEGVAMLRELVASPEGIEQARVSRQKGAIAVAYPHLGKALGISAEDERRVYDILDRQLKSQFPTAQRHGGASTPDFARTWAENDAELAAFLGSKYSGLQEFRRGLPARQELRDLRAVLNANKTPLTDTQEASVLRELVAAQHLISLNGDMPRHSLRDVQRYQEAVSPYLTSQQFDAFQKMMERKMNYDRVFLGRTSSTH